jgi:hypothetical protein
MKTWALPLALILCLGLAARAPVFAAEKEAPRMDQSKVDAAIKKGTEWLRSKVQSGLPDFEWEGDGNHAGQTFNEIVMYTLLHAGATNSDPDIVKLLNDIRAKPLVHTYGTAIRAQALEKYDPAKLFEDIRQCCQFLVDNQAKEGYWGYSKEVQLPPLPKLTITPDPKVIATGPGGGALKTPPPGRSNTTAVKKMVVARRDWGQKNDNSNTQYAMLGIAACMAAGIHAPADTYQLVETWLADAQNDDGGWGYDARNTPMHGREASYGSMTAGGVSTLSICIRNKGSDPMKDVRIQKGLQWLGKNLTFDQNPAGGGWMQYYWIYSVERAGSFSGTQWFADRPWYYEGAAYLCDKQSGDGTWGEGSDGQKLLNTCWSILFLKQASKHIVYSLDTHKR